MTVCAAVWDGGRHRGFHHGNCVVSDAYVAASLIPRGSFTRTTQSASLPLTHCRRTLPVCCTSCSILPYCAGRDHAHCTGVESSDHRDPHGRVPSRRLRDYRRDGLGGLSSPHVRDTTAAHLKVLSCWRTPPWMLAEIPVVCAWFQPECGMREMRTPGTPAARSVQGTQGLAHGHDPEQPASRLIERLCRVSILRHERRRQVHRAGAGRGARGPCACGFFVYPVRCERCPLLLSLMISPNSSPPPAR